MPTPFHRPSLPASDDPLLRRLAWLCPGVTLIAFAALTLLLGFSLWTAVALALLLACPLAAGFAIVADRRVAAEFKRKPR
jgi:hypothetical protein